MLVYQRVRAILVFTRVSNKKRTARVSPAAGQKHTRDLDSDVEVDEVEHIVMVKKAKVGTQKWWFNGGLMGFNGI